MHSENEPSSEAIIDWERQRNIRKNDLSNCFAALRMIIDSYGTNEYDENDFEVLRPLELFDEHVSKHPISDVTPEQEIADADTYPDLSARKVFNQLVEEYNADLNDIINKKDIDKLKYFLTRNETLFRDNVVHLTPEPADNR